MATAKSNSQVSTLDEDVNETPAAAAATTKVAGANHDSELSGKKQLLTIAASELEGGHDAVFLSLNGYSYQIPRDTPCEVPSEVVDIIKNARVTSYTTALGGGVVARHNNRYAFSVEAVTA